MQKIPVKPPLTQWPTEDRKKLINHDQVCGDGPDGEI